MKDGKKSLLYDWLRKAWIWCSKWEDKRLGVDFSSWRSNEELGIDKERGNQYQPTTRGLRRVLKKLPVGPEDAIIDIGCGKGKAMYLMSSFPFGRIDGFDLSEDLCAIARQNLKRLKMEKSRVYCGDAVTFDQYDAYNYFYIFNSFPEAVFQKMLAHIQKSLECKPRKVYFIYLNPVYHDCLIKSGTFSFLFEQKALISWFTYRCYENTLKKADDKAVE